MRTLSDFLSTLPTKTSPNGTEKLTALDGSALVGVPNQSYQVVDGIADLPASIPVGVQILTRDSGTMWRGLVAGESSLPAGTPIPVRGYWSITAQVTTDEPENAFVIASDFASNVFTNPSTNQARINTGLTGANGIVLATFSDTPDAIGNSFIGGVNNGIADFYVSDSSETVVPVSVFVKIEFYPPAPTP
jgi:hypothetical protein